MLVAAVDLGADYPEKYDIVIGHDSVFPWSEVAHHGLYLSRYQFRRVGGAFALVGLEWQSATLEDIAKG